MLKNDHNIRWFRPKSLEWENANAIQPIHTAILPIHRIRMWVGFIQRVANPTLISISARVSISGRYMVPVPWRGGGTPSAAVHRLGGGEISPWTPLAAQRPKFPVRRVPKWCCSVVRVYECVSSHVSKCFLTESGFGSWVSHVEESRIVTGIMGKVGAVSLVRWSA